MKVYKLTRANGTTKNNYKWSLPTNDMPGEWHKAEGEGTELCSNGYLHWYHHPLLAALLYPRHINFGRYMVLWEGEARGDIKNDKGMKGGSKELRLVRKTDIPAFSSKQKVAFAIYIAQEVYSDKAFAKWACAWLDDRDRSKAAAEAAAEAAARAAGAAGAAAWADAWAAEAAGSAWADAWAAEAAAWAAEAAAWAAEAATDPLELLIRCAEKAYNFKP